MTSIVPSALGYVHCPICRKPVWKRQCFYNIPSSIDEGIDSFVNNIQHLPDNVLSEIREETLQNLFEHHDSQELFRMSKRELILTLIKAAREHREDSLIVHGRFLWEDWLRPTNANVRQKIVPEKQRILLEWIRTSGYSEQIRTLANVFLVLGSGVVSGGIYEISDHELVFHEKITTPFKIGLWFFIQGLTMMKNRIKKWWS